MKNLTEDTIFALSTPLGQSAIAVIRVSGPKALSIAKKLSGKRKFHPRTAYFSLLKDPKGEIIDSGLIIFFKSPESYTGEDLVEIQSHGSIAIINKLLQVLSEFKGTRFADAGEFSMRGYKNLKADIIHYEGLASLITAETNAQRLIATKQTFGSSQNICKSWRNSLIQNIALLDAEIDFVEDHNQDNSENITKSLTDLLNEIESMIKYGENAKHTAFGQKILIFGPPNAGKSSFFNFLCQEDRMITSNIKGTTIDQGLQDLELFGKKIIIIDSAGLGKTDKLLEKKGIKKTINSIEQADNLILVLSPDSYSRENSEILIKLIDNLNNKKMVVLFNKLDTQDFKNKIKIWLKRIPELKKYKSLSISCLLGRNDSKTLIKTNDFLNKELLNNESFNTDRCYFSEKRQIDIIKKISLDIKSALESFDSIEIACNFLNEALKKLDKLYGKNNPEEKLELIFKRFCIGK